MKLYVNFVILASAASIVCATDFFALVEIYLPFLKSIAPPPPCPPNEVYSTCMQNCSDCTQRGVCLVSRCEAGCDCHPRFYRTTADGPCVPVANCPKPECGENEIFRECGPICERCTTIKCRAVSCDHKCYCKQGYLRDVSGKCIKEDECPKRTHCARNEEWADSGIIDEFCMLEVNGTYSNETQNVAQCYCKEGFKRHPLGYCRNETACDHIYSGRNQVYHKCVPKCNTTCRSYGELDCNEDEECYPGFFCRPGYVMNDFEVCTLIENCSLDIVQLKTVQPSETMEDDEKITTTTATPVNTTDVVSSSESNFTVESADNFTTDSEEISTISTDQTIKDTTLNPTTSQPIREEEEKTKSQIKFSKQTERKQVTSAKSKSVSKQEIQKDEDDFDNEDI